MRLKIPRKLALDLPLVGNLGSAQLDCYPSLSCSQQEGWDASSSRSRGEGKHRALRFSIAKTLLVDLSTSLGLFVDSKVRVTFLFLFFPNPEATCNG